MLSLSQTTGYAIKALGCLSNGAGATRQTADVAKCTGVPGPYLSKILRLLVRAGLVVAKRGIGGGITLARPPAEVSLLEVVEAVEGKCWLGDCLLGFDACSNLSSCPTHEFWLRVGGEIRRELERTSLAAVFAAALPRVGRAGRKAERPGRSARARFAPRPGKGSRGCCKERAR